MDVGNPSNFERLLHLFDGDAEALRAALPGDRVDDGMTRSVIREVFERHRYVVDPHTATGLEVWRRMGMRAEYLKRFGVVLATAHPAKFIEVMEQEIPGHTTIPDRLAQLRDRQVLSVTVTATSQSLIELL
jgi:threonine synthase